MEQQVPVLNNKINKNKNMKTISTNLMEVTIAGNGWGASCLLGSIGGGLVGQAALAGNPLGFIIGYSLGAAQFCG